MFNVRKRKTYNNGDKMKLFFLTPLFLIYSMTAVAYTGDGSPFKYISSCEIDLNKDSKSDKVIMFESLSKKREVIALIATKKGYKSYLISDNQPYMNLKCSFGPKVVDVFTAKAHKTPGTFIELIKPESSSVAYYWKRSGFKKVWTTD